MTRASMVRALLVVLATSACATARVDRHVSTQLQLEARIAAIDTEARQLRAGRDSLRAENDSLRSTAAGLEADVREREEQIRALRLELQRLKEIDLKPRVRRPVP